VYIGTFWAVTASVATDAAKIFYQHIFDQTISEAPHLARERL
jgi:hypothetical protein